MIKVFLVEDEYVIREESRRILTGRHMDMNSAEKQEMESLLFR